MAALLILAVATAAAAQSDYVHATVAPAPAFWTPEEIAAAKPQPLPRADVAAGGPAVDAAAAAAEAPEAPEAGVPEMAPGREPLAGVAPDWTNRVGTPGDEAAAAAAAAGSTAHDQGRARLLFSSSRVFPPDAVSTYPYRAAGILFFQDGSGSFLCSAALIQRRVLLTAGHCVYDAATKTFNTKFAFLPAYNDGLAPFGTWSVSDAFVTTTWMTSREIVPNAADYALLVLQDMPVNGQTQAVGSVVGWLGYQTLALYPNHVTMLGFPNNFDNSREMHRVDAQSDLAANSNRRTNSVVYGSDMSHGASGGPWVQNFGVFSAGQVLNTAGNVVVGVTSFGPNDTSQEFLGASVPDTRLTTMLKAACAAATGNCQ